MEQTPSPTEATLEILHVFADENGQGGNLLGTVRDMEGILSDRRRQKIAEHMGTQFGLSETVFINAMPNNGPQEPSEPARVSIYTQYAEFHSRATPLSVWQIL